METTAPHLGAGGGGGGWRPVISRETILLSNAVAIVPPQGFASCPRSTRPRRAPVYASKFPPLVKRSGHLRTGPRDACDTAAGCTRPRGAAGRAGETGSSTGGSHRGWLGSPAAPSLWPPQT